ncbi:MAG: MFS transporter, partial [Actinomycetota bacterium]
MSALRSVFAVPDYRRLWGARTVSQWGDTFRFVALAVVVYRLTGSGLGVAGVVVAEILPVLLLAPLAGVLVDRVPRVAVLVVSDVVRAVLAGVLALRHGDVVTVYAVAFGMSAASVFFNPAAQSVLPSLVRPEQLPAANSGIWTTAVLSQVVLAPAAGGLVVSVGPGWAFALDSVTYLVSGAVLIGLRLREPPREVGRRRLVADAREGANVVATDPMLRALALGQLLAALSAGATSALLVVLGPLLLLRFV